MSSTPYLDTMSNTYNDTYTFWSVLGWSFVALCIGVGVGILLGLFAIPKDDSSGKKGKKECKDVTTDSMCKNTAGTPSDAICDPKTGNLSCASGSCLVTQDVYKQQSGATCSCGSTGWSCTCNSKPITTMTGTTAYPATSVCANNVITYKCNNQAVPDSTAVDTCTTNGGKSVCTGNALWECQCSGTKFPTDLTTESGNTAYPAKVTCSNGSIKYFCKDNDVTIAVKACQTKGASAKCQTNGSVKCYCDTTVETPCTTGTHTCKSDGSWSDCT